MTEAGTEGAPPAQGGILQRVVRGSAVVALGFAAGQGLRLAANLILARLLFPEAFGLMALMMVFLTGLQMFSDTGLSPSIARSPRGDDPEFLDTAFTIQAIRGVLLFLGAAALAVPAARLYDEPLLAQVLPVGALALLIAGLNPTRIETANRHLMLGRVTLLDLAAQAAGIAVMVAAAWATGSVWALVWGSVAGAAFKLVFMHLGLPGRRNRFRWNRAAAGELIHFGKWIFLSTGCGFLLSQGDKAILGHFLTLELLGIYNIGFFLAAFPALFGGAVVARVLIPLYRERPPAASAANFARIRRLRFGLTAGVMALLALMGAFGDALVGLLYDPRYALAGAVVVAVACAQIPPLIGVTYDQAALAAGDSRRYFLLMAVRAAVQTAALLAGAAAGGLLGAVLAQGLALVALHGGVVWLARRHGAWDPLHDAAFGVLGLGVVALALALHRPELAALAQVSGW